MSKRGQMQAKLGSPGATAIQADSAPLAVADANDRPGWLYVKDGSSAPADKFNWYYYDGTNYSVSLKHMKSLFWVGSVDTFGGNPFIVVYTKMTGSGDAGAWYHSRHSYSLNPANQTVQTGERCIFHALEAPVLEFDGARKIALELRIDTGAYNPDSEILYITLHSDSSDAAVTALVENMGVDFHQHQYHTKERTVNLKVIT